MVPYGGDLRPVVLDATVSADDQPSGVGHNGDPIGVKGLRARNWAGRSLSSVYDTTRIARVGDVGTQRRYDFRESKHVGIEVEANFGRLGPSTHAARSAFS